MGVRELAVQMGPDEWVEMQRDDGSLRRENLAVVDHVLVDEDTGAFRWRRDRGAGCDPVVVSVFDGRRAAGRFGSATGPSLIRYEGAPAVVSRLAGWLPVDAAWAYLRDGSVPKGCRVRPVEGPAPERTDEHFELPSGRQRRLWRQLEPDSGGAIDLVFGLGAGGWPEFAASLLHFERGHRRAAVVVYPGVCVTTSERRLDDPVLATPWLALADGRPARAAVGRTRRDGSFTLRASESATSLGFAGYELALAGVGTHGLAVETERHMIVVTGTQVGARAVADLVPLLQPL